VADPDPAGAARKPSTADTGAPAGRPDATSLDLVELWGLGSFPASDPPATW
jgi:hypothetical protein